MGATAALRVLLSHPIQDTAYPIVSHLVTIAAPFNSGLGSGGFDHAFDHNTIDPATKRPRLQVRVIVTLSNIALICPNKRKY